MTSEHHLAYLNLGSNIQPEINLVKAVELLHEYGDVLQISGAWESKSVGAEGPNYLNACVLFKTTMTQVDLKENIIRPIEARLGRSRNDNKHAPRTIDIDIVLFDDKPYNNKFWRFAFVIVPLAEIHPEYQNPIDQENITITATRLRSDVWMEARPEVLGQFRRNSFKGQN
ncbi:MAG TPA: 2-amino-4-hydroxy-6-hydroxymethyldihydropteridine diphosphokinase [Anaerolineales bacterium]|nr:2-amino-4-hydroxy-6-hydroxymethyldihydropteridine diphosphokinase [Anaerolineales bacterium]